MIFTNPDEIILTHFSYLENPFSDSICGTKRNDGYSAQDQKYVTCPICQKKTETERKEYLKKWEFEKYGFNRNYQIDFLKFEEERESLAPFLLSKILPDQPGLYFLYSKKQKILTNI